MAYLCCRVEGGTEASALGKVDNALAKLGKAIEARKKKLEQVATPSAAGLARCVVGKLSCLQPRGTFDLALGHGGLELCKSSKDKAAGSSGGSAPPELCVRWDQVACVQRFPRPDPYKTDKVRSLYVC